MKDQSSIKFHQAIKLPQIHMALILSVTLKTERLQLSVSYNLQTERTLHHMLFQKL